MIWSLAVLKRLRVIRYLLEIGFFLICNAISVYKAKKAATLDPIRPVVKIGSIN